MGAGIWIILLYFIPGTSKTQKKAGSAFTSQSQKRTAAGIPTWSPTVVLICRSTAYVWQSGRDAQFSAAYGRSCWEQKSDGKCSLRILPQDLHTHLFDPQYQRRCDGCAVDVEAQGTSDSLTHFCQVDESLPIVGVDSLRVKSVRFARLAVVAGS